MPMRMSFGPERGRGTNQKTAAATTSEKISEDADTAAVPQCKNTIAVAPAAEAALEIPMMSGEAS